MDLVSWFRVFCLIFFLGVLWTYKEIPDGRVHLYFCDVGQGDGAVISYKKFQAVIDVGAYEDKFLNCLERAMPFWDRKIELVILSHSDKDHVGAMGGILERFEVGKKIEKARYGDRYRYASLSFDIFKGSENNTLVPMSGSSESNESSIVVLLRAANFKVLFTGDIDMANELAMVTSGVLEKVDVLKVAHHGSKYSSSDEFLRSVEPKYAVVSVGKKNSYGHPNGDVLMRLDKVGAKVLRTDQLGTIEAVLVEGGVKWVVHR